MEHSFDIDVAKEYGILEAVLVRNFQYWILKNKANGVHCVNEHYWTYNSISALQDLFPYATAKQIRKAIDGLVEKSVLVKGHLSENPNDRTNWFAFADEKKWIVQKGQMDLPEKANGFAPEGKCIINTPSSNTNNKPNNTPPYPPLKGERIPKSLEANLKDVSQLQYDDEFKSILYEWLEYKSQKGQTYKGKKSIPILAKKLYKLSGGNNATAKLIVEQSMANNWSGLFALKDEQAHAPQNGGLVISYKGMIAEDPTIPDRLGYLPVRYQRDDGTFYYVYQH